MSGDLLALLGVLETLKKQHKAGINPTYGQVDDLFALGDAVRASLSPAGLVELPIPGWGAPAGDADKLRAALAAADERAQQTQARILQVEEENARLRDAIERCAAIGAAARAASMN